MVKVARSVFYSFQYEPDNWRVQQVMKMGALSGESIFSAQDWESVRRKTDRAIESWTDRQMKYARAVVVLVGSTTADSRWVRYEIEKAWDECYPLLGIRINSLKDRCGRTDRPGDDPFSRVTLRNGQKVSDYVHLIEPRGSNSQEVYNSIENNLQTWVNNYAYRRR